MAPNSLQELLGEVKQSLDIGLADQARLIGELEQKDEIIDGLLGELSALEAKAAVSPAAREIALRRRAERDYHQLNQAVGELCCSLFADRSDVVLLRRTLNILGALYDFSERADAMSRDLTFDVIQAHDNFALWPASRLAGRDKAPLIADLVEVTHLHERVGAAINTLPGAARRFIESMDHRIIQRADAAFTVSTSLLDVLQHRHKRELKLLRNARYYADRPAPVDLHLRCAFPPDTCIVSHANRIGADMGIFELIDALPLTRHKTRLVCIGKFTNKATEDAVRSYTQDSGLSEHVAFLEPMPPMRYAEILAASDVGTNVVKPLNVNLKVSLPNRVFDYITARIPVVTSDVGDSGDVVKRYGIGEVFEEIEPVSIAEALDRALDRGSAGYRQELDAAARELSWEEESAAYLEEVQRLARVDGASPRHAAIVARKPIKYNNRIFQQAKLLAEHGFEVTIFSLTGFEPAIAKMLPPTVREVVIAPLGG